MDSDPLSTEGRLSERLAASFAILLGPPEPLPKPIRVALGHQRFGMDWDLAQRLATNAGVYWAVPGDRYLCIVSRTDLLGTDAFSVGATCASVAWVVTHGLASVTLRHDRLRGAGLRRLIAGVAPNRARAIRVHTRGAIETAHVVDNTFVLRDRRSRPPDNLYVVPRSVAVHRGW